MKELDILGEEPKIFIFGERRYRTFFGAMVSMITVCLIMMFIIYFFLELIDKKRIYLLSSQKIDYSHQIDLQNYPMIFKLGDALGNNFDSTSIFPLLSVWNYYPEFKGKPNITKVFYEKCDINKHFGNYKSLFNEFLDLGSYFCIPPNKYNLTLYGKDGDFLNGFSKISFHILKCNNNSVNNPTQETILCNSKETTQKALSSVTPYFTIGLIDYEIDHNNKTEPLKPYTRMDRYIMSPLGNYKHNNYLKFTQYISDDGFFFEDFNTYEAHQYSSVQTELLLGSTFTNVDAFGLFSFYMTPIGDYHKRSYLKFQQLIANTGGVANALIILTRMIVKFFSQKLMYEKLINETIEFDNRENKENFEESKFPSSHNINIKPSNGPKRVNIVQKYSSHNIRQLNLNKNSSSEFQLKLNEFICFPFCLKSNKNFKVYKDGETFIKKSLSTDKLLILLNQFEMFKLILLEHRQLLVFNNIKKKKLNNDSLKTVTNIEFEKHLINLHEDNTIDKKLLKYFQID